MNERNEKTAEIEDQAFVAKAKELFDESVQGIDAKAQSRLNRGRHDALAQLTPIGHDGKWIQWGNRMLPAAGFAAAAVIAVVILKGSPPLDELTPPTTANDFEILLDQTSFEMLEELEFYSWIDLEAGLEGDLDESGNVG